jgi:uncharacterized protein YeaO (DUF488 family)
MPTPLRAGTRKSTPPSNSGFEQVALLGTQERRTMSARVPAANVKLKRAYEPPSPEDGTRILVDRLWPRGVSKQKAALDHWMKEIAPSTELRKWFGHDPKRWKEFRRRYAEEMRQHPDLLAELRSLARRHKITLVYSAHDETHNDAVVLRDVLLGR